MRKGSPLLSSSSTEPDPLGERVLVGRVARPQGIDGSVAVHPETDNPARFHRGAVVETADGARLTVERSRWSEGRLVVRFAGSIDRTAAEALRGAALYVPESSRRPLEPGEFWPDQLIGLTARAPDGSTVGRVVDLVEGAAQHRLVIETPDGEVEVPFVADLVPEVDTAGGFLVVVPIDGLLTPPPTTR